MAYKIPSKKLKEKKGENEEYEVTLKGDTYDLRKIKGIDRVIFLEGTQRMGTSKSKFKLPTPFYEPPEETKEHEQSVKIFNKIDENKK